MNALVLYIGQHAVSTSGPRGGAGTVFDHTPHSTLMERLVNVLRPEAKQLYLLLSLKIIFLVLTIQSNKI